MIGIKKIGIGLFLAVIMALSVLGTVSFAVSEKGGRGAGSLKGTITGNVLYTPILLDFESDGKIEIIVGSHDTIRCLEDPDGNGDWSVRWEERIGSSIHNSPNIADLEGDGEVEVLMISESADSLFAIDSNGNTKWQYNYRAQAGYSDCHSSVASADLNFDGTLETLFSCQSSGKMLIINEDGNDDVIGGGSVHSGGWHSSPAIAELDGDDTNLEYIHQGASGTIYAVKMGGAMLWEKSVFPPTTTNPSPAIGDLNQDGKNEVIVVSEQSNNLYCLDGATGNENWHFTMSAGSMSSPALADLDVDELWEVIIGDTSGNLYCIDHEGEEVWRVNLGTSIKPSPAIADLDSDGLLEIVEVSNDGKCWAIDEDGSVMWSYETHESIPTSSVTADPSPVIGDVDSDGYLEVLFATGSGTLRSIETDGQVPSSALPWPMFRYDREHTGFYNGTLEYGASITVDEEHTPPSIQSPLIHFIEPGETTYYNLTLTNVGHQSVIVGMFRDRFTLSVENVPENWTASLSAYNVPINDAETVHHDPHPEDFVDVQEIKHVQLGENGEVDFTLKVTAPRANVSFGDFAPIDAFAMSESDNNATDSITTTTFLDLIVDLKVDIIADQDPFTGKKVSTIAAGADKMLMVDITNMGNLNDTYDIRIRSGIPSGWTVSFSGNDPTVHEVKDIFLPCSLFGLENTHHSLSLYVHCPQTAAMDEHVDITITGTSRVSENSLIETVEREDTVEMIVKETNLLTLEIMDPEKHVDPGSMVAFTAVVTNRGNSRANVELTLINPQRDQNIPAEERWLVYWEESHIETHTVVLRQHEPFTLRIILKAPDHAVASSRIVLDVKAIDLEETSTVIFKQFTAIVNEKYEYEINFTKTTNSIMPGPSIKYKINMDLNKDGEPEEITMMGKIVYYNFTMHNTGNTQDEVALFVKDTPTIFWTGHFEEDGAELKNLAIDIDEVRELTFVVFIPEDAVAGLFDLGMTFRGRGDDIEEGVDAENDPQYRVVKITILEIYDMQLINQEKEMTEANEPQYIDIDPGAHGSFRFRVTNQGNTEDHFRITADGFPDTWDIWISSIANRRTGALTDNIVLFDFDNLINFIGIEDPINYIYTNKTPYATVQLDIGETAWITMNVQLPVEQVKDVISVYVNVTSWDVDTSEGRAEVDETDNLEVLIFNIENADLLILKALTYADNMKGGETYSVSTTIGNVGDILAEEVLVVFKVDGIEVDSRRIQLIGVGQEKLVYFSWTARGGTHRLTIEIDPNGDIIENNDQYRGNNNNFLTEETTVEGISSSIFGISLGSWGIFAAIAVGGILGIIATGMLVRKVRG